MKSGVEVKITAIFPFVFVNFCENPILSVDFFYFFYNFFYNIEKRKKIDYEPMDLAASKCLPKDDQSEKDVCDYTLPDLHGNTLKLLQFLRRFDFIEMKENDYNGIFRIYQTRGELTQGNIDSFKSLIDGIKVATNGKSKRVRLIGDEIADRGMNDCLTFLLFKRMKELDIQYEIIYSNHADFFWGQYDESHPEKSFDDMGKYFQFYRLRSQQLSLSTMVEVVRNNPEIREEIVDIIKTIYKPRIKLLSCSLSDNDITIFTHAPAGLEQIEAEANKMGVICRANSIANLKITIDEMNETFRNNFLGSEKIKELYNNGDYRFVWERNEDGKIQWPHKIDGKDILFVHGHDSKPPTSNNVFNLELDTTYAQNLYYNVPYYHNKIGKTMFQTGVSSPINKEHHYGFSFSKRLTSFYEPKGPLVFCRSLACITKTNKDGVKSSQKQHEETKDTIKKGGDV